MCFLISWAVFDTLHIYAVLNGWFLTDLVHHGSKMSKQLLEGFCNLTEAKHLGMKVGFCFQKLGMSQDFSHTIAANTNGSGQP